MMRLPVSSFSPISNEWVSVPTYLSETSCLLRNIFHKWRVSACALFTSLNIRPFYHISSFSVTSIGECMIKCLEIACEKSWRPAFYLRIAKHRIHWGEIQWTTFPFACCIRKEYKKKLNVFHGFFYMVQRSTSIYWWLCAIASKYPVEKAVHVPERSVHCFCWCCQ